MEASWAARGCAFAFFPLINRLSAASDKPAQIIGGDAEFRRKRIVADATALVIPRLGDASALRRGWAMAYGSNSCAGRASIPSHGVELPDAFIKGRRRRHPLAAWLILGVPALPGTMHRGADACVPAARTARVAAPSVIPVAAGMPTRRHRQSVDGAARVPSGSRHGRLSAASGRIACLSPSPRRGRAVVARRSIPLPALLSRSYSRQ
jgi:hypothetical protein